MYFVNKFILKNYVFIFIESVSVYYKNKRNFENVGRLLNRLTNKEKVTLLIICQNRVSFSGTWLLCTEILLPSLDSLVICSVLLRKL